MGQVLNGIFSGLIALGTLTVSGYALHQLGDQIRAASLKKASEGLPALQSFANSLTRKKKPVQPLAELSMEAQK